MRPAAFFDVDGTLLKGNIVEYYVQLRGYGLSPLARLFWFAGFVLKVPLYILLDQYSRRVFSRAFYRNYRNLKPEMLPSLGRRHFHDHLVHRIYPEAVEMVRLHQSRGEPVVLVTGSLDVLVDPVAEYLNVDAVIAASLVVEEGRFTGKLKGGPLTDRRKAEAIAGFALEHDIDPAACYAYADSLDDLPMLESVGHAGVVNPGRKLRLIARNRGWNVYQWHPARALVS